MLDSLITLTGPAFPQRWRMTQARAGVGHLEGHHRILPATRVSRKNVSARDKFGDMGKGAHIEEEDKL